MMRDEVRQHFRNHPYPPIAIEGPAIRHSSEYYTYSAAGTLFRLDHSLRHGPFQILDVGCGTGVSSVGLLTANPGCQLVGVDVSDASVAIARRRCEARGLARAVFHVLAMEDLAHLGMTFDYINCDDTLYLLDNPLAGLKAMRSVLAENGVLRVNVHNQHQRGDYLRAQQLLRVLGVAGRPAGEALCGTRALYSSLDDNNAHKRRTWRSRAPSDYDILANHLIVGDRGFSFDETLELLSGADLELLDVVDGPAWDWRSAFPRRDETSTGCIERIGRMTRNDQLRVAELLEYRGRLFDLYTCKRGRARGDGGFEQWSVADQSEALVQGHPGLILAGARTAAIAELRNGCPFNIGPFLARGLGGIWLSGGCLELFVIIAERRWPMKDLEREWMCIRPVRVEDRKPKERPEARAEMLELIASLSRLNAVLVERGRRGEP